MGVYCMGIYEELQIAEEHFLEKYREDKAFDRLNAVAEYLILKENGNKE